MIKGMTEEMFDSLRDSIFDIFIKEGIIIKVKSTYTKHCSSVKRMNLIKEQDLVSEYFSVFDNENEAWWCLLHKDSPFNHRCSVCGKEVSYSKYNRGYDDVCSNSCRTSKRKQTCVIKYGSESVNGSNDVKEKFRKTCLERYGVDHPLKNKGIKEHMKQTCLDRYGVDSFSKTDEFKSKVKRTSIDRYGVDNYTKTDEYKDKLKNTCVDKYGVEHYSQTDEFKDRFKQTCFDKYGVDNYTKTDEFKDKYKQTCIEKYGVDHYSQTDEFRNKFSHTCLDKYGAHNPMMNDEIKNKSSIMHNSKISDIEKNNNCLLQRTVINRYGQAWLSLNIKRLKFGNNIFISNDDLSVIEEYSKNTFISCGENDLLNLCRNLVGDENVISHDRSVISPYELDIYIPSKNLAIEFNGMYWHSSKSKDKMYHFNKTNMCKEKGIRLIHIWEDLWKNKKPIYESIIKSAVGIYDKKIYARKCEYRTISKIEYDDFLTCNHIQGSVNSSLRVGLFYDNELVQVAGWGKSRFKQGEYELHRMCSKLNTQVVGGFSKIIKHSGVGSFISYVDSDIYDGHGYESVGFEVIGNSEPSYFYYKNGDRINRVKAQKHRLPNLLEHFDQSLSETDNMLNNGYMKLYDSGNMKVRYSI